MIYQNCNRDITIYDRYGQEVVRPYLCPYCHHDPTVCLHPEPEDDDVDDLLRERGHCPNCD